VRGSDVQPKLAWADGVAHFFLAHQVAVPGPRWDQDSGCSVAHVSTPKGCWPSPGRLQPERGHISLMSLATQSPSVKAVHIPGILYPSVWWLRCAT
jgi:hypothetical protein